MNANLATVELDDQDAVDQELCAELLDTVDALSRRRADLVDENLVAKLVRKGWLQWHGGALQLTSIGARLCDAVLLAYR